MHAYVKKVVAGLAAAALTLLPASPAFADGGHSQTATPIKHLVIIFQENISFDHYFATYPNWRYLLRRDNRAVGRSEHR
jgi:phospholipase C